MPLLESTVTTDYIGTTFAANSQWYTDELEVIGLIRKQINHCYPEGRNLFINSTWFGPQFDNDQWKRFEYLVSSNCQYDRLFVLAAADPIFLNADQIAKMAQDIHAKETFLLGHFDSEHNFNFHSLVLKKYFHTYTQEQLLMQEPQYVFLNYNRKPRGHRADLVRVLEQQQLDQLGLITLGENSNVWENTATQPRTLGEQPEDYAGAGNWGFDMGFGIPHDIHSLGNLNIWQRHFLTVVGETEFLPWDPTFVSEKTWKPILGLRPFVINGQSKAYRWLRDRGFRTFNHVWPVDIDSATELDTHDKIAEVIKWLGNQDLTQLYQQLLPDLIYNRKRFDEFSNEQFQHVRKLF